MGAAIFRVSTAEFRIIETLAGITAVNYGATTGYIGAVIMSLIIHISFLLRFFTVFKKMNMAAKPH